MHYEYNELLQHCLINFKNLNFKTVSFNVKYRNDVLNDTFLVLFLSLPPSLDLFNNQPESLKTAFSLKKQGNKISHSMNNFERLLKFNNHAPHVTNCLLVLYHDNKRIFLYRENFTRKRIVFFCDEYSQKAKAKPSIFFVRYLRKSLFIFHFFI